MIYKPEPSCGTIITRCLVKGLDIKQLLLSAGGDHTIAYPILQAVAER